MRKRFVAMWIGLTLLCCLAAPDVLAVGTTCGEGCMKCEFIGGGALGTVCDYANWENGQCSCWTVPSSSGFGSACWLTGNFCFGVVVRG